MEKLPVIFRVDKFGDFEGEVTAVFPTVPGTNDSRTFNTYDRIGQHSAGCRGWYNGTRAATSEEYGDLLSELSLIYSPEYELDVKSRFTQQHDKIRRAALES